MSDRFKIEVDRQGARTTVAVSGIIDEGAELAELAEVHGDVAIDLEGVRRINSFGVRMWIEAMRKIPADTRVTVVRCAPPMVEQMNMIHNFFGRCRLESFFVPMLCPECEAQHNELFDVAASRGRGGLTQVSCPTCGAAMEVDDIEDQYLFFLGIEADEL